MGLRVFAVALMLLALPISSAGAQGFLDALFGFGASRPRSRDYDRPRTRERESRSYSRERETSRQPVRAYYNASQNYERSGTYRTYCVRMCDGYYFPINYASTNLTRDAERCSASCDGARLFYHRTGGEPEEMIDLTGRSYTSYPLAFKYRTELVEGCQCRPPPWTDAELERHRAYASKAKLSPRAQTLIQTSMPTTVTRPPAVNVTPPVTEQMVPATPVADHPFTLPALPAPIPRPVSESSPHGPPRLR